VQWVGSIGDNRLGGWYACRASNAAFNMLIKTAAIELARTRPQTRLLSLHPDALCGSRQGAIESLRLPFSLAAPW
jgi:capsule polysaccharide export protein KpsC/LpsZ